MKNLQSRLAILSAALAALALSSGHALAQKKYDTGASDTEIKIGNIMPYSGPASSYGMIGKTEEAYFRMVNETGGINGRKINFLTYDDGYSPPKAVEQARKLVESDEALLIFNSLGTASNTAIQKYMNAKKIPQLFVATGAAKWNDPKNFPWTMGWQPNYQDEARIYAKYVLKEKPGAKIAVLYQNDDFGKDYVKGFKEGLGDKAASMIVIEESYEVSEPSIDSHIVKIKAANPDTLLDFTTPKFAAQTIKKIAELQWKPLHILTNVSISIGAVMKPAGIDASQGVLSADYRKDPLDPQWKDDAGMKKWAAVRRQVYAGRRQSRQQHHLWLRRRADHGRGAKEKRRRSHPRKRHEAGCEPERLRTRRVAAGHQDQHQRVRLRADPAGEDDALQGRGVGAVRRDHLQRNGRLVRFLLPSLLVRGGKIKAPATSSPGAFS